MSNRINWETNNKNRNLAKRGQVASAETKAPVGIRRQPLLPTRKNPQQQFLTPEERKRVNEILQAFPMERDI